MRNILYWAGVVAAAAAVVLGVAGADATTKVNPIAAIGVAAAAIALLKAAELTK